jgi:hypothetical protein
LKSTAYRLAPNWLVSCWLKMVFSRLWIVEVDVDGSKTYVFGPRFGLNGSVGSTGSVVPPPVVRTSNSHSE